MKKELVVCIRNAGYEASLERRKLCIKLDDPQAAKRNQIRVIDESGEDFLFPTTYFIAVSLPVETEQAVIAAA